MTAPRTPHSLWAPCAVGPGRPPSGELPEERKEAHHDGPIREVTFKDEAKLLITVSDDSVKLWDALNGSLRKEIKGQVVA